MWINLLSILLLWKLNPKTRFFFQRLPPPAQGGKSIWAPTVAEHLWGAERLQRAASSEGAGLRPMHRQFPLAMGREWVTLERNLCPVTYQLSHSSSAAESESRGGALYPHNFQRESPLNDKYRNLRKWELSYDFFSLMIFNSQKHSWFLTHLSHQGDLWKCHVRDFQLTVYVRDWL